MHPADILDETMASWQRERPDLDLAAMETTLRLNMLVTIGEQFVGAAVAAHGVSLGEFDVLAALRRSGNDAELTPSILAKVAMLSPSGMTNRLDRLEEAGLLVRRPDPSDRRVSLISLTPRGRKVADQVVADIAAVGTEAFSVLSPAEHDRLDRTLDRLISRLAPPPTDR
jgi:DNA-binding MarR family transcriptional regulator